jgi:tRNA(fMet)-specific endonuclease VapC
MTARYLLDTNIASYMIKDAPVLRRHVMRASIAAMAISTVTEGELRFGIVRRPEATRLRLAVEEFLLRVPVLSWDSEAARQYAQIRATLEAGGQVMGGLDMMISAHALSLDATLVTNDRAFSRIAGLRIEDWTRR